MKPNYTTSIDPINYDAIANDSSKHLRYRDYKHLKDVDFDDHREEPIAVKIMATMGLIACFIVILFIA